MQTKSVGAVKLMSLRIVRANGRVENIGTVQGGTWLQRLHARWNILVANFRTNQGRRKWLQS